MSWNIKTPGDYINGPLTVAGATTFNSTVGIGEAAVNGIKLVSAVTTATLPQTSGVSQPGGAIRVTGQNTTGCLDIGTAGAVSWLQACRRTNLADNFSLVLNPNGGFVGVATASPGAAFDIGSGTLRIKNGSGDTSGLLIAQDVGDASKIINYYNGPLIFGTNNTERARINSTGAFVFVGGTANANGIGIAFPAAQSASTDANTLDDYEEGTFTPAISGTSVAGAGTYSNQIGRYTKVGNQVTVWIRLSWSAHTGSGDMTISGLPFALSNVNNLGAAAAIGYTANISITAGNYLMVYGDSGNSRAYLWQTPTGGGSTPTVAMDPSGDIGVTMTYFI